MTQFKELVKTGLKAIIPFIFIVLVFYFLLSWTEKIFGSLYILVFGQENYFWGSGLIVAILLIPVIGLVMKMTFMKRLYQKLEDLMESLPVVKSLYRMATDVFQFFSQKGEKAGKSVVLVNTPLGKIIGILTTKDPKRVDDDEKEEEIAVYFPMSYQIGGFTFLVPKSQVEYLDMEIDEALEYVMTAWITRNKKAQNKS